MKSEKYKHVYFSENRGKWYAQIWDSFTMKNITHYRDTEKEAARCADFILVNRGDEPVNGLKFKGIRKI